MRIARIASALLTATLGLQAAEQASPFRSMTAAEAERNAFAQAESGATMYIWADKYVYRPGERLTLRWTVNPNNELYPYTIVAFRTNNQTGARTYLPGGGNATDIFGNTVEQGFAVQRLTAASKAVLVGDGGSVVNQALTIPEEFGMHTITVQLRDYTGTRVLKSAYFKIGVVEQVEDLQGEIASSRTLTNRRAYNLRGLVTVRNNAVLTIEPGTFIIGQPGSEPASVLLVSRNGRIVASGTRSRPIIMTSSIAFGQRNRRDWGGLILAGRAPINDPTGERNAEGLTPSDDTRYGGTDANYSCGTLRYVRVEFAGSVLSQGNEVNGVTFYGCGKGTVAEYLQVHYAGDDAFEWFGGNNDAKYLVASYATDDSIDAEYGYTGRIQYALILQNPTDSGSRGFELDNNRQVLTATPQTKPTIFNVTMFGSGVTGRDDANPQGIAWRSGVGGSFNNIIISNFFNVGIDIAEPEQTGGSFDNNSLTANGILLWNNGRGTSAANTTNGQVSAATLSFAQGTRGQGRQFLVTDPMLIRPMDYSDPDFRPMTGSPVFRANWIAPPDDGFFDQSASFIGAFGEIDWTEEWTNFVQEQDIQP